MTTPATERVASLTALARVVLESGDHDTALNLLDQATAASEQLVREDAEDRPELLRELVRVLGQRAELAMLTKRFDEAEAGLQRALGLLEQLPDADLKTRVDRYVQLASLYRQTERWRPAIRLQTRATDFVREHSEWRRDASAAFDLAGLLAELADVHRLAGDYDAAEAAQRQSLEVLLAVPAVPGAELERRARLATAVSRIADIASEHGQAERAAQLWLTSNEIRESPNPETLAWAAIMQGSSHRYPSLQSPSHLRLVGLAPLLGLERLVDWTPDEFWSAKPLKQRLRVPIGVGISGETIALDFKESALGGDGPHGLLVGATGSGKSELLRTIALALALTHPPDVVNLLFIDRKGGAAFRGLAQLPHVAGLVSNLADEPYDLERVDQALRGELSRRQEILRAAGEFYSVREYEAKRQAGTALEPLPSVFVLIDEFSELLASAPEFVEVLLTIGRVGRSLGVHLLLASQRLEEGRLRGLDGHLSFRLGLRTFSAVESRVALGDERAYALPSRPGAGYLKTWTTHTDPVAFQSANVSGPEPDSIGGEPAYRVAVARIVATGTNPARLL
jgi:DNA segregation ATPase FtsK/SpoIIIE-like protein